MATDRVPKTPYHHTIMKKYELRNIARILQAKQKYHIGIAYQYILSDIDYFTNSLSSNKIKWVLEELSKCKSIRARILDIDLDKVCRAFSNTDAPYSFILKICRLIGTRVKSIQSISDDLCYLKREFCEVIYSENEGLSVVTDDVIIDGFNFNKFEIFFPLTPAFYADICIETKALDPEYPSDGDTQHSHPHVQSDYICAGNGMIAITQAIKDLRLLDYFTIVNSVLNTYNDQGPYLLIEYWTGFSCHNCTSITEDYKCNLCSEITCSECTDSCANCDVMSCELCISSYCDCCDSHMCNNCVDSSNCSECFNNICNDCILKCDSCDSKLCKNCNCKSCKE